MVSTSLMRDPIFLLFAISNLLTSVGFNSPLYFLPLHAQEGLHLTSTQGSKVLSVFGKPKFISSCLQNYIFQDSATQLAELLSVLSPITNCHCPMELEIMSNEIGCGSTTCRWVWAFMSLFLHFITNVFSQNKKRCLERIFTSISIFEGIVFNHGKRYS